MNFNTTSRFPIARTEKNLRGTDLVKMPEFKEIFESKKSFSVMIYNGKGELEMRFKDGEWFQVIHSVDRCFGIMKSKPTLIKFN